MNVECRMKIVELWNRFAQPFFRNYIGRIPSNFLCVRVTDME